MTEPLPRGTLRHEWPVALALAANVVLIAWTWPRLPAQVPVHWNLSGQVDRFGDRFEALLMLPLIFLFPLLISFAWQAGSGNAPVFRSLRLGLALLGLGFTTQYAFGWDIVRVVGVALGLVFVLLGNVMGKTRPSPWIGFRTPWTARSRRAWQAGQRRSGLFLFACGLLFAVAGLSLPRAALFPWLMPLGFVLVTFGGVGYLFYRSYLDFKADPDPRPITG